VISITKQEWNYTKNNIHPYDSSLKGVLDQRKGIGTLIGIGGVSRSGKSKLAHHLEAHFKDGVKIFDQDQYVKTSNLPRIKDRIDWEHPATLDWRMLISEVKASKLNEKLTIVEGIFAFHSDELNSLYDRGIWLHIDH
jgi:hypothetical protein